MLELRGASTFKSNALNLQIGKEAQRGALADLRPYDADMHYLLEPNNLHATPLILSDSHSSSHLEKKINLN